MNIKETKNFFFESSILTLSAALAHVGTVCLHIADTTEYAARTSPKNKYKHTSHIFSASCDFPFPPFIIHHMATVSI